MFRMLAARTIAVLFVLWPPILSGPGSAIAQSQVSVSAIDPAELLSQMPAAAEPFGLSAVPVMSGELLTKWSGVAADIRAETDILARCRDAAQFCPAAAQKLLAVIADGRAHTGRARIGVINRAVNLAIKATTDLVQWGVPDRWSAPLETFASGRGDCEDYAIAKYVALTEAGVSEDDVKLVIVRNLAADEDHAVVAARLDDKWMVLDNRWMPLVEDMDMPRVIPLFVFDHDGVKQFMPKTMAGARDVRPSAPSSLRF